jgi:CO/xanthine dehydrogenase Mo-binding subunit
LLERLVDKAAREMKMDRLDIRRKNFIPANAFPYQTPVALQYDSGDYQSTLAIAEKKADVAGFEKRRAEAKSPDAGHRFLDLSRGLDRPLGGILRWAPGRVSTSPPASASIPRAR